MSEKRGIVIHFVDGSSKTLEFPEQAESANQASRIREALEERTLVLEADGALVVFPFENIKYIQAYPAPKKLPDFVIRGAAFKE